MCGRVDILAEASVAVVRSVEARLGQCQYRRLEVPYCKTSSWELGKSTRKPIFGIAQMHRYNLVSISVQLGCKGGCVGPSFIP